MRQLVKIIKEICLEADIEYAGFSGDWIINLRKDGKSMQIAGYKFPQNSAAVSSICDDKAALSDLLGYNSLPCVPHYYFMSPDNLTYIDADGNWSRISALLDRYGKLVLKPNRGTGGRNVCIVSDRRGLEAVTHALFGVTGAIAVSPFVDIRDEYRVILLDGRVMAAYRKRLPSVTGNGTDTLGALIAHSGLEAEIPDDMPLDRARVPADGEICEISWKHNLGQGSTPELVSDPVLSDRLSKLALDCASAINIRFASFDIISTTDGLKILEINSGIMLEKFSQQNPEYYEIAKNIYRSAVFGYFGI